MEFENGDREGLLQFPENKENKQFKEKNEYLTNQSEEEKKLKENFQRKIEELEKIIEESKIQTIRAIPQIKLNQNPIIEKGENKKTDENLKKKEKKNDKKEIINQQDKKNPELEEVKQLEADTKIIVKGKNCTHKILGSISDEHHYYCLDEVGCDYEINMKEDLEK